jgi:hypothetical protein
MQLRPLWCLRPKIKIAVVPVTRPTLRFAPKKPDSNKLRNHVYQSYVTYTEVHMRMTSYSRILTGPFHIWKTRHSIEIEAPIKSIEVNIEIKTIRIHNLCKLSVF